MNQQTLLIELLCEELPPKNLKNLSQHFANSIIQSLISCGLINSENKFNIFATPRRLAVQIFNVLEQKEDYFIEKKGPAVSSAFDDKGAPTKALIGFAKSCALDVSELTRTLDGNREVMFAKVAQKGADINLIINEILNTAIKTLPVPKNMRWGELQETFVRPVHHITILFGEKILAYEKWNIKSNRITDGHRFLGKNNINIPNADSYESILENEGSVIASFAKRQEKIIKMLDDCAKTQGGHWFKSATLLDEVTAITEFPFVIAGEFEKDFLQVPQEALMGSMMGHQKYFPILTTDNKNGKLLEKFLIVANMKPVSGNPDIIRQGNQRVLRARLADAKFFYETDCSVPLDKMAEQLNSVTYLQDLSIKKGDSLGTTQSERVARIVEIAKIIATKINSDLVTLAAQASALAKADLVSGLVGEFPELQGIAGAYYAQAQNINGEIAIAISEHYQPRFSGDEIPQTQLGQIVALADKFESITGIFGVGKTPSGDKDPYSLRRHALGIVRILIEKEINFDVTNIYCKLPLIFASTSWKECSNEVHNFILERLRNYLLEQDYSPQLVAAVVSPRPTNFFDIKLRISALADFMKKPAASALITIGKRIRNIVKTTDVASNINPDLFENSAEKDLYQYLQKSQTLMLSYFESKKFDEYLQLAINFEAPLAKFFEDVMVNDKDEKVRQNRLALLSNIDKLINAIGQINELI